MLSVWAQTMLFVLCTLIMVFLGSLVGDVGVLCLPRFRVAGAP